MGADNWAPCPQCIEKAEADYASKVARVYALYGKVTVDEFDALRAELKPVSNNGYFTFREDYEIYTEEGVLRIDYSGGCSVCGLNTVFRHEQQFWTRSNPAPEAPER